MNFCISALLRMATVSWVNLSTMALGVPLGAISPSQPTASKPLNSGKPDSAIVGTWGNWLERVAEVTPSGTALPAWMLANAAVTESTISGTWLPRKSACAGPLPL